MPPVTRLLSHVSCLMYPISHLQYHVPVSCLSVFCLLSDVSCPYQTPIVSQLLSPVSHLPSHVYCLSHVSCLHHVSCLYHVSYLSHVSVLCLKSTVCLMYVSCLLTHVYCLSNISLSVSCLQSASHRLCVSRRLSVSRLLSVSHPLSHLSFSGGVGLACSCVSVRCTTIVQIRFLPVLPVADTGFRGGGGWLSP